MSPHLPSVVTGRRLRDDDRRVLNGIVWRSAPVPLWRDVLARYGSWKSIYTRFRRWALNGTFDKMLVAAQAQADANADIDRLISAGSPRRARPPARRRSKGGTRKRANRITSSGDPGAD
ncbi:transposase [Actinoplanes sp. NPDC051343]|uniref:transposase n=1 Tax=Actinoplanes sp. NPDC051343 TaxID=3363906 RepID=UPI0037917559